MSSPDAGLAIDAAMPADSAAPPTDAGPETDAGSDAGVDAAQPEDAARPDAYRPPTMLTLGSASGRPATLYLPTAHDGTTPLPLMLLLHGFGASGSLQNLYFGASSLARTRGVYLIVADGTTNSMGSRFWNATPACCDREGSGVDDVAYLTGLLDEAAATVPVDPDRVYSFGHSNGGFMSYRLACELSDRIAAIASLAGSDYAMDTDCVPAQPVSVLQIHGTLDDAVEYDGSAFFPGAQALIDRWGARAGCDLMMGEVLPMLDIDGSIAGAETTVERWSSCTPGHDVELWTIVDGPHIPPPSASFTPALFDWLLRHTR